MIPILYESTEKDFDSNGLGRLRDCISCVVTEERNGIYECDFEYPVGGHNYEQIQLGRIIAAEHDDSDDIQPFDIISCTRPINGIVTFHAVHVSYRLSKSVSWGTNITSLETAFNALSTSVPTHEFGLSYKTSEAPTGYVASFDGVPRSVRQFLGGVEGSILDTYGGEYEFNKFNVMWRRARGEEKDFTIRYGVDLIDYNEETDYSESYSSVVPFWTGDSVVVRGDKVTAAGSTYNGRDECVPLDLTDKFEEQPTSAQLTAYAQSFVNSASSLLPKQTITVDFVRLADSLEHQALANLYKCKLCDTIKVDFPMYQMKGRFKIVRTEYDVLKNKFIKMELGTLSTTLAEALGIDNTESKVASTIIVETGTDGIWTYRKWSDGTAECWGKLESRTYAQSNTWGSAYYTPVSVAFPSGLFSSAPTAFVGKNSSGAGLIWCSINDIGSTYVNFYVADSNSGSRTCVIGIRAIGRWK